MQPMKQTSLKNGLRGHVSTWQKYDDQTEMSAKATFDYGVTHADGATEAEALRKLAKQLEEAASQIRAMAVRAERGWLTMRNITYHCEVCGGECPDWSRAYINPCHPTARADVRYHNTSCTRCGADKPAGTETLWCDVCNTLPMCDECGDAKVDCKCEEYEPCLGCEEGCGECIKGSAPRGHYFDRERFGFDG